MRNFLYDGKPPLEGLKKQNAFPQPPESTHLNLWRHYGQDPSDLPARMVDSHIVILDEEHKFWKWQESQRKK